MKIILILCYIKRYRADNIKETVKATKKLAETKQNDDGSNSEDVYLHKRCK